MVGFGQRIECDQALGERNCRRVLVLLLEDGGQTLQDAGELAAVVVAQGGEPIVVQRGQEVVLIELRRGGEGLYFAVSIIADSRRGGFGDSCLEINRVDGAGSVLAPANREVSGDEKIALGRQRTFEMMQKLAQIGSRLRLTGGRPKKEGEPLAGLRDIAMQDQAGNQRLKTVGIDSSDRLSGEGDPEVAEQA